MNGSVTPKAAANRDALLTHGRMALERSDWEAADEYFSQALTWDANCADAYLGKLMTEYRVSNQQALADCETPFDGSDNYKHIVLMDAARAKVLDSYLMQIRMRNKVEMTPPTADMSVPDTAGGRSKKKILLPILIGAGVLLAALIVGSVLFVTKLIRPEMRYREAAELYDNGQYEEAAAAFEALNGYSDSDQRAEEAIEAGKKQKYDEAAALMDSGRYDEAITVFEALGDYADSRQQIENCRSGIRKQQYDEAMALIERGSFDEAYAILEELGREDEIRANKYDRAKAHMEADEYDEAYALFEELGMEDEIEAGKYEQAHDYLDAEDYDAAYALLEELGKDDEIEASKQKRKYGDLIQTVIDNESVWRSVLPDNLTSSHDAKIWFQDLDMDDIPELLVSYVLIGARGWMYPAAYRYVGGRLVRLYGIPEGCNVSSLSSYMRLYRVPDEDRFLYLYHNGSSSSASIFSYTAGILTLGENRQPEEKQITLEEHYQDEDGNALSSPEIFGNYTRDSLFEAYERYFGNVDSWVEYDTSVLEIPLISNEQTGYFSMTEEEKFDALLKSCIAWSYSPSDNPRNLYDYGIFKIVESLR